MTVARGFAIVGGSTVAFGAAGAALGVALARVAPGYYRNVFRSREDPTFDPVQVGLGLGLTQGLLAGVVVGCVVVLAASWFTARGPRADRSDDV